MNGKKDGKEEETARGRKREEVQRKCFIIIEMFFHRH